MEKPLHFERDSQVWKRSVTGKEPLDSVILQEFPDYF